MKSWHTRRGEQPGKSEKRIWNRAISSKSTISRVLNAVDGQAVREVILKLMRERIVSRGEVIAVDGKAIRSTVEKGNPHSAFQILSAYLTENDITLAQDSIHEKSNEISVFRKCWNIWMWREKW